MSHRIDVTGRVKRKLQLLRMEQAVARAQTPDGTKCALCLRPLGDRVEWHHRRPKSEGGTETVPVHPICHRTIHAHVSNHELARVYTDLDVLRSREDMQRFLRWLETKPANFSAPTRRKQS